MKENLNNERDMVEIDLWKLLGAYLSRVTEDSHAFKANLCMVFAVENTFRIALYMATGVFTAEAWRRAAVFALSVPM